MDEFGQTQLDDRDDPIAERSHLVDIDVSTDDLMTKMG